MVEKDVTPRQEAMRPPDGPPPTNEGRTVAAWTTTWLLVAGGVVAALGLVLAQTWMFWTGLGVGVLALVVGKLLQAAGYGQSTGAGRPR